MRRLLLSVLLVALAIVVQLTVLDRLPLPGGVSPDLVLLVVVALALSSGPVAGALTGFGAGLALDIAPPADHLIGVYALVFCLVGYFCGLVAADLENTVLLPLAASAVGAAVGAALYAGVGILLGNPDVTGQAVRRVLPVSVLYDVLLSPFVLYGVALASRFVTRLGAAPAGWLGGGGWLAASAELARRRPPAPDVRLHLGGGKRSGPLPGRAASQGVSTGKATARLRFAAGHRGDGVVGGGLLGAGMFAAFSGHSRARTGPARIRPARTSPARTSPARTGPARTPRLFGRRSRPGGAMLARFSRRPAWGFRGAGGSGGSGPGGGLAAPRRGAFTTNYQRKARASAALRATPRRGTFAVAPQRKRQPATGSPRRGAFRGGSSAQGTFGAGAPRRGAFSGPRRLRTRRPRWRGGHPAGGGALGRVRGGRSTAWGRSSPWPRPSRWRTGHKRDGG